ncbi:MAG: hypothetical protein M3552_08100 [Planctomycetota bacterium]|nr:hypothetical protein [Planctomycetota bacterium]
MGKPRKPVYVEPEPEEAPPPKPSILAKAGKATLRTFFRPKRLLLLALIPVFCAVAPVVWKNWPDLDSREVYRLKAADVHITPPPRPVPSNLVERAVGTAALDEELSVLDRTLLSRLADAFAKEPWVKQVVRLRKGLPAHVEVELEYRMPAAMIDVKQGVYPVDAEGMLLPPEDFSAAEIRRYPLVTGITSLPGGAPGMAWGETTVIGAAKVAAALAADWDALGLTSIQAPPPLSANVKLDDLTFELRTRNGSTVVWGRPPGTGHPGELTVEQKLGRLKQYVADFGPLDAPGPSFEIDIRPWQEMTRRPLASARQERFTRQ